MNLKLFITRIDTVWFIHNHTSSSLASAKIISRFSYDQNPFRSDKMLITTCPCPDRIKSLHVILFEIWKRIYLTGKVNTTKSSEVSWAHLQLISFATFYLIANSNCCSTPINQINPLPGNVSFPLLIESPVRLSNPLDLSLPVDKFHRCLNSFTRYVTYGMYFILSPCTF